MGTETINPKRTPLPGPRTLSARYTLLGAQLLRQQTEVAKLYSERLLSVREAAEALSVTPATIRAYAKASVLRSIRIGKVGWIKIPFSSVRALLDIGVTNG